MFTRNGENNMREIRQEYLTGERALFQGNDIKIYDTIFAEGESPLKESQNIKLYGSMFKWKYPLWYSKHIILEDCTLFDMARAGIWYTDDITVRNTLIEAPKNFRRTSNIVLDNVIFSNAQETLWYCSGVKIKGGSANGDYFAMSSENIEIEDFTLFGNYSFDGAKNIEVHNAKLLSRDAFWNCENVTVYDSCISGEYLGWNAKNLTFINCKIESLQGLCYIDNLIMKNCELLNTTLAFEYSTVDAQINGKIQSVLNPTSGTIQVDHIGELIIEKDLVDESKTKIICNDINEISHTNKLITSRA